MYSPAELQPYYVNTPPEAIPQSTTPLGEDFTYSGTVRNWQASRTINLYAPFSGETPPSTADGQLSASGQISFSRRLFDLAEPTSDFRKILGYFPAYCPMNTLRLSKNVQVRLLWARLRVMNTDIRAATGQGMTPQSSPPPPNYRQLVPASTSYAPGSTVDTLLLWSPEPFTAQGETRCLEGSDLYVGQYNTRINVKLERGWNALTYTLSGASGSTGDTSLRFDDWAAAPVASLTDWH
ncbi:hypothetical protein [Deinococcus sonorensis]|uniref:Uncharacterized protein n=2 Tax=Deinococcus sonorensis TaxID=309891 RepID=A0AAU7UBX7_9DEIO